MLQLKKVSSYMMSMCMIMGLGGCNNSNKSWIAKYNEDMVPVGIYIQYVMEQYRQLNINNFMGKMQNPGDKSNQEHNNESLDSSEVNETKKISIYKKLIEGKTGEQWIKDNAKEKIIEYVAINDKFKKLGFNLSQENIDSVNYMVEKQWDAINERYGYEKNGVSSSSVSKMLLTEYRKNQIFESYYGNGGKKEVIDDDVAKYLGDKYNKVEYYSFNISGLGNKEKKNEEDRYEEFLKRVNNGEDIKKLASEFDKKTHNEKNKDTDIEGDDDLTAENERYDSNELEQTQSMYYDKEDDTVVIYKKDDKGQFTEDIQKAIDKSEFDIANGFKGKDELIVFVKKDVSKDDKYIEKNRNELLKEMKDKEFKKEMKSWINIDEIKFNEYAINKYTAKKLKLD